MDILRDHGYLGSISVLVVACIIAAVFAASSSRGETRERPVIAPGATPTRATPTTADDARRADLAEIAEALDAYFAIKGTYPVTEGNPSTICAEAFDPPCLLLTTVADALPSGDGTSRYWYVSDGASFTLFAAADDSTGSGDCGAPVPPRLADGPVLCLVGEGRP